MKFYTFRLIIFFTVALAIVSCHKHKDVAKPEVNFNITSPLENALYNNDDTVFIKATITGPVEMHGYTWEIKNTNTAAVLASGNAHTHSKSYTVNDKWVNNVADKINAELVITTEIDHDGNTASSSRRIVLLP
jgi:hypothetical protein